MGLLTKALDIQKNEENEKTLQEAKNITTKNWDNESLEETKEIIPELFSDQKNQKFLLDALHSSTRPVYAGIAQQNQIEALLNLIEFSKEMGFIESEEDLWKTVMITLLGQLGCKELAVFFKMDQHFILKLNKEFKIDEKSFIHEESKLMITMAQNGNIRYTKDILESLPIKEKEWLEILNPVLLVPIFYTADLIGIIFIGNSISFEDYNLEDLIYLKNFGDILGSYYNPIKRIAQFTKQNIIWEDRDKKYLGFDNYFKLMEQTDSIENINNHFIQVLKNDYGIIKCIFLVRENKKFTPQIFIGLHENTIHKFTCPINESWILEINQVQDNGWIEYIDFKANGKFIKNFALEDISLIENVFINPIRFKGSLDGVFLLFDVAKNLLEDDMRYLHLMIKSYFWGLISHKSNLMQEAELARVMEDPLYALRSLIEDREKDLINKNIPYSLLSIKISNGKSLRKIWGDNIFDQIKNDLKLVIQSYISDSDYVSEIFPSLFFIVLKGSDDKSSENIIENVKNYIQVKTKDENKKPLLKTKNISRPDQDSISLDSFLFD